jgi:hypothetical protein
MPDHDYADGGVWTVETPTWGGSTWEVVEFATHHCSGPHCPEVPVARRTTTRTRRRPNRIKYDVTHHFCKVHLAEYRCWIEDGQVLAWVYRWPEREAP